MTVELESPGAINVTPKTQTFIVDAAGGGDATVIQTGLDLGGDNITVWIKAGTYAAGFTEASDGVRIFIEAGTIIQAGFTVSGDDCVVVIGAGADIQGRVTFSGLNGRLICSNGVDTDGLLLSGNFCSHDGGGWDTLHNGGTANDAINITGTDCIVKNCAAQTTTGGGQAFRGVDSTGARTSIVAVKVVDSDDVGIVVSGVDSLVGGCMILGADGDGLSISSRVRVVGNHIIAAGDDGIVVNSGGDDSVITGNVVRDPVGDSIQISADGENCVVVGNRLDGAVNDGSGTSTVANNETDAF